MLMSGAVLAAAAHCQPANYPYVPAMYQSIAGVSQWLEVYPFEARARKLPLPFPLRVFSYSPDGSALYATVQVLPITAARAGGIVRLELGSMHSTLVPGSEGLGVQGIAALPHGGGLFVTGSSVRTPCGLFKLEASGSMTVLATEPCDPSEPLRRWGSISVSPDGTRAVLRGYHRLELAELATGKVTRLPSEFVLAAWSPDGKWLAVIRAVDGRTVLLDARTLESDRVLGMTDLVWSPDSKYLISHVLKPECGSDGGGTLELVDVVTGKRREVASSMCRVDRNTLGWVRRSIVR